MLIFITLNNVITYEDVAVSFGFESACVLPVYCWWKTM